MGTRPCARKASATFRRRSCCVSPRWRGDPLALVRSGCSGSSHSAASSVARRSAAWCPRFSLRSGSPGTKTTHAASGRATDSRTTEAAQAASRRRPRSFQAITTCRSRSSYTSTARACANASRRPAHSPQRCTGQAVGAPQRAQSGGSMRRNAAVHPSQHAGLVQEREVAAHRFGGDVVGLRQFSHRGTALRDHQRGDRLLTLFGIHETPFVW